MVLLSGGTLNQGLASVGKLRNPEENPRSKARINNKLNPHETASKGIELGSQRWEAYAYPLRQPTLSRLLLQENYLL